MLPISAPNSPETAANFFLQTAKGAEQNAPRPEKSLIAAYCPSTKPTRLADGLGLWKYPTRRLMDYNFTLRDAPRPRPCWRDVGSPCYPSRATTPSAAGNFGRQVFNARILHTHDCKSKDEGGMMKDDNRQQLCSLSLILTHQPPT